MLSLKPTCENCNKSLPADSQEAMICSYECTFCTQCVSDVLNNVCPNCGGGFVARPIRPKNAWREGVSLADQPASTEKTYKPVSKSEHDAFAKRIAEIPSHLR